LKIEALRAQLESPKKRTFVYLTKMNSAKDVLISELMLLHKQGRLKIPIAKAAEPAF
jgi:hypothetical protein